MNDLERSSYLLQDYTVQVITCPPGSLVDQWLRLCASSAGGTGSVPGQGTKIHTVGQQFLKRYIAQSR